MLSNGVVNNNKESIKQMWTLTHTIMAAMGAMIIFLLSLGYYGIMNKIEIGDALIRTQMIEITTELKAQNVAFNKLCQDVARIDTYQKIRLDRESIENKRK